MNSMDKNQQSSQNELDLGLNQEPITPKKTIQPSSSILGKAKGLFAKKNHVQTNFQQRKEPTFGDSSTQENDPLIPSENLKKVQKPVLQTSSTEENISAVDEEISAENNADEPVEKAEKPILAQPEKWKILQVLPAKHRRLFMAIFVLVILLIIFFALKPSSDTVESFTQSNSNEVPVQFQSLDQSQPLETTILDNPPAQNQMAVEQANQSEFAPKAEEAANNTTAQNPLVENAPMQQNVVQSPSQMPNEMAAASVMPMQPAQAEQPKATVPVQPMKKAVEPQVAHKDTVKKEVKVAENAQAPSKATEQNVAKTAGNAPIVEAKPVQVKKEKKVQIVDAKPVQVKKEKKVQIVDAKPVSKSAASRLSAKTLTVPKGVSLMQVFRDNQLNISDVNAMSKAAGAGNVLSSFKSGDKVTVSVNNQGRVNEMRLSNGARFVRQSDGSYQYKK
ncbi:opacity-associated protein OapA [Haemophilus influenzae]|uniref:opacity-associated protein OapA n=1 Tax=Haemophilus influenzae TaxID=727 RepID=UPI0005D9B31F|nr:opacity-associated protein OapA [Haemophilus influenzae]MCK8940905.1 opacity-associated protein OapA [Haemophilus influenzae]MCK9035752.1 opacity-associated protein OapA [Haemophilus influenzae]MCK9099347.1 opacity-associated protein OapA [Haemophilus influenzae]PRI78476.1 Opacity-associated protein A LysM-like domain protein [Haemophilus influenzae]PRI83398.1 Opacity-associated protein A LysM-like domain protein [Haemophilus influenzae]